MTRDEFKILVKAMKAVYTDPKFIPDADAFAVWYSLLQDLEYKKASAALQKHMQCSKWPPTVADIREQAFVITEKQVTAEEVFVEIKEAAQKGTYWAEESFESLSPLAREVVRSADTLRTWASEDEESFNTVQKAYILKAVEQTKKNQKEMGMVSPALRQLIEKTVDAIGTTEVGTV